MHKALYIFFKIFMPSFLAWEVCRISYHRYPMRFISMLVTGVGGLNQNRLRPNGRAGVHGVGSRGPFKPLGMVQGQPRRGSGGRAPGSSCVFRVFKTSKRLSSHNILSFFEQVLLQNQLIMLIYDIRWQGLVYLVQMGLQEGRSDFAIKEWFSSAQTLRNLVFLKLESCNLVNTLVSGTNLEQAMRKYQLVQLLTLIAVAICLSFYTNFTWPPYWTQKNYMTPYLSNWKLHDPHLCFSRFPPPCR